MMEIPFTCCDEWVNAAFVGLQSCRDIPVRRDIPDPLPRATALLLHDSFHGLEVFEANLARQARMQSKGTLEKALGAAFAARTLRKLGKALAPVTGLSPAQRMQGIGIRTRNPHSQRFRAPTAAEAGRAAGRLFEVRRRLLGQYGIGAALASYLVLLSIHPFADGNGRTARMLFAADVNALDREAAAHVLLGLVLLHRGRSQLFHLSALCARAGDFTMLATCYAEAMVLAGGLLPTLYADRGSQAPIDAYRRIDGLLKPPPLART